MKPKASGSSSSGGRVGYVSPAQIGHCGGVRTSKAACDLGFKRELAATVADAIQKGIEGTLRTFSGAVSFEPR